MVGIRWVVDRRFGVIERKGLWYSGFVVLLIVGGGGRCLVEF